MSQFRPLTAGMLLSSFVLAGCADRQIFEIMPDSPASKRSGAAWPGLAPASHFDQRRQNNEIAAQESEVEALALEARVARLRARAARLRGPVLTRAERARLRAATTPG